MTGEGMRVKKVTATIQFVEQSEKRPGARQKECRIGRLPPIPRAVPRARGNSDQAPGVLLAGLGCD